MILSNPEGLVGDLEYGIAEVHPSLKSFNPDLRLRMEGVGEVTAVAIAEHFELQGYETELIASVPRLPFDIEMSHVFPLVHYDDGDTIIDTNYTSLLRYAGMSPGYVMLGGTDLFPYSRIAMIENGVYDGIVKRLTECALKSLAVHKPKNAMGMKIPEFTLYDEADIESMYQSVWDPGYFKAFTPTDRILQTGKALAALIRPENAQLEPLPETAG